MGKQGLEFDEGASMGCGGGPDVSEYPTGLASAPVMLDDVVKMKFLAGFFGYKQDEKTLEITPNVAWCITNSMTEEEYNEMIGWTPQKEKEYIRGLKREKQLCLKSKEHCKKRLEKYPERQELQQCLAEIEDKIDDIQKRSII